MAREFPGCPFERYADDAIVHCKTRHQAELVLVGIAARMEEVGLRLHPDKTRIVYCKDSNRRGEHEHISFTFLGYAFRPREAIDGKTGKHFTAFSPAISPEALKAKSDRLRELRIHRRTDLSLDDLARWLNPIIAGWMNYYGQHYRSALYPLLQRVNTYLRRWAGKKYKRLRTHQAVQAVVGRTALETARPVRPLAVGPRVLMAGEKSPVTGDCHAGILWEPGGEIPPGDPTARLNPVLVSQLASMNEGSVSSPSPG